MDLKSITIRDFRSIGGEVTIPLDAPIVLIHGVNGAGKTSVLSALEMALTGATEGLHSHSQEGHARHLVHRGATQAQVTVTTEEAGQAASSTVTVGVDGVVRGRPALDDEDRRAFVERCYLAQARVSRLLEIYQSKIATESPLTTFVKDLLGLDRVDAIIDGFHSAGHQARIRGSVPGLRDLESELVRARKLVESKSRELVGVKSDIALLAREIDGITAMSGEASISASTAGAEPLGSAIDRQVVLRATLQEIQALSRRFSSLSVQEEVQGEQLAREAAAARRVLDGWESGAGLVLRAVAESAGLPYGVEPTLAGSVQTAYSEVREHVRREIARTADVLRADEAARSRLDELNTLLAQVRERATRLEGMAENLSEDAPGIAVALTNLVPFIDGEVCPVCRRDHSETSDVSLIASVSARISALNEEANRLQSIAVSLKESASREREVLKEIDGERSQVLEPGDLLAVRRSHQEAVEWDQRLKSIESEIPAVVGAQRQLVESQAELARFRNAHSTSMDIRSALGAVADNLGEPAPKDSDSLHSLLARYSERAGAESAGLAALLERVERLREARDRQQDLATRESAVALELGEVRERAAELQGALDRLEHVKTAAKAVSRHAETVRSRAVAEVFTSELNGLWRDLFIRLVPSEPFVPVFAVGTDPAGRSTVELRTSHRDGGTGGEPGLVLSAGNLNTSAVTLFFALHLVANVRMPWLILDDPVQSMDEVHIAQFAALLRGLAKGQGKKIVIAVHEKSLFDYLALELSPSYEGDRLVTVELSRPTEAVTLVDPEFVPWSADSAFEEPSPALGLSS